MLPKSFLYSNAFMAKWHSQTLSFKSMTDKNTHTNLENLHNIGSTHAPTAVEKWKRGRKEGKGKVEKDREGKIRRGGEKR